MRPSEDHKRIVGVPDHPCQLRDLQLRCVQWKQWKVYPRRKAELIRLGVDADLAHTPAWSPKGPWRLSHTPGVRIALNVRYFDALGLPRLDPRAGIQLYL